MNGSPDLARNRRRARAQAREALAAERKRAENEVAALEEKLEALEKRRSELLEQLSGGGRIDFSEVNRELSQVQTDIAATETAWESAAEALEEVRRKNAEIHQG